MFVGRFSEITKYEIPNPNTYAFFSLPLISCSRVFPSLTRTAPNPTPCLPWGLVPCNGPCCSVDISRARRTSCCSRTNTSPPPTNSIRSSQSRLSLGEDPNDRSLHLFSPLGGGGTAGTSRVGRGWRRKGRMDAPAQLSRSTSGIGAHALCQRRTPSFDMTQLRAGRAPPEEEGALFAVLPAPQHGSQCLPIRSQIAQISLFYFLIAARLTIRLVIGEQVRWEPTIGASFNSDEA